MNERKTRRGFLRETTATGLVLASSGTSGAAGAAPQEPGGFTADWAGVPDRVWLGPEFWANPLQDWRIAGGRIECVHAAPDRHVHLLTRELGKENGDLTMSVHVGRAQGGSLAGGKGSFGFRVGIKGPLDDYRSRLVSGVGLNAGATADGTLFVGDVRSAGSARIDLNRESVELRLSLEPDGDHVRARLAALDVASGAVIGEAVRTDLAADRFAGGVALVANFAGGTPAAAKAAAKAKAKKAQAKGVVAAGTGTGAFWFATWRIAGTRARTHDDRGFGPILFSHYTQSRGVLKLTAQMPPMGAGDSRTVRLQARDGQGWKTLAEEPIHAEARTATFRIAPWDATTDASYRLAYALSVPGGKTQERYWSGTIRRDPVDKPVITLADVSCNTHAAFPNAQYVANMARIDPDLIAFVGDQFYESSGGYGVVRAPLETAILDYLRKWSLHGWTWRELTRNRPSLSLPDDHDVYQGNIWGEGGAPERGTQEMGGYEMPPAWVNVVYRTQTAHHPDLPDPAPVAQGIGVFFGPMTYGRISFAVIADRQFKSGPEGKVPPTGSRGDHVVNPSFDPKTADRPGLELLGERQERFLRDWAADWHGAEMKAVISETIFAALATTHGGGRERLRADYDANGWPQTARNRALREIRKAFAVHIAGDQHLPAVVHYGIDAHRDASIAFSGPAVNVGYPRWWEPEAPGTRRAPDAPENTGDFLDHFGNPITVLAVANGAERPRAGLIEGLHDRASGLGIVRFDKPNRTVTFECWPLLADVSAPGSQFPGWPVTVRVLDEDARRGTAHLPRLDISGINDPVVQVVREPSGEIVYTLRVRGQSFRPHVDAPGAYTIRISEPETGRLKELRGVAAVKANDQTLSVTI